VGVGVPGRVSTGGMSPAGITAFVVRDHDDVGRLSGPVKG
jgi:hypothetical protein